MGGATGVGALTAMFGSNAMGAVETATQRTAGLSALQVAQDEDFWRDIQQAFTVSRGIVNLNSGSSGACPAVVTDSLIRYLWQQEEAPAYQRGVLSPRLEMVRAGLAGLFDYL